LTLAHSTQVFRVLKTGWWLLSLGNAVFDLLYPEVNWQVRAHVDYGGDDVTSFFMAMLKDVCFPYAELDLRMPWDMALANDMKEKFCTMNEVIY
jgi:hypothetical protein